MMHESFEAQGERRPGVSHCLSKSAPGPVLRRHDATGPRGRFTRISTGMLRLLEDAEDAKQDLEEEYTESNDLYSVRVPGQVRCYFNDVHASI